MPRLLVGQHPLETGPPGGDSLEEVGGGEDQKDHEPGRQQGRHGLDDAGQESAAQFPSGLPGKREGPPEEDVDDGHHRQDHPENHRGVLGGQRQPRGGPHPQDERPRGGGGILPEKIDGEEDEEGRAEVGGDEGGMGDEVRLQRRQGQGHEGRRSSPEPVGPPPGEADEESSQKEVGKPSQGEDPVPGNGRAVQEVPAETPLLGPFPEVGIRLERDPVEKIDGEGGDLLDEGGMLRVEPEVPAGQVGVARGQVDRFVAGLGVGGDEGDPLGQEEGEKEPGRDPGEALSLDLFHNITQINGMLPMRAECLGGVAPGDFRNPFLDATSVPFYIYGDLTPIRGARGVIRRARRALLFVPVLLLLAPAALPAPADGDLRLSDFTREPPGGFSGLRSPQGGRDGPDPGSPSRGKDPADPLRLLPPAGAPAVRGGASLSGARFASDPLAASRPSPRRNPPEQGRPVRDPLYPGRRVARFHRGGRFGSERSPRPGGSGGGGPGARRGGPRRGNVLASARVRSPIGPL